jgi:hypothetical protein
LSEQQRQGLHLCTYIFTGEDMTQDEIIEMAKQAWLSDSEAQLITEFDEAYISCTYLKDLTAFAKLVAQHEREECAKVCDSLNYNIEPNPEDCAEAIRARSKND